MTAPAEQVLPVPELPRTEHLPTPPPPSNTEHSELLTPVEQAPESAEHLDFCGLGGTLMEHWGGPSEVEFGRLALVVGGVAKRDVKLAYRFNDKNVALPVAGTHCVGGEVSPESKKNEFATTKRPATNEPIPERYLLSIL